MENYKSFLKKKIKNSKIVDIPIKCNIRDYDRASREYLNSINPKKIE
jgi:hypothetical protein